MIRDEYESREDLMITKFGKKTYIENFMINDDMIARQMKTDNRHFMGHQSTIQDSRS